MTSPLDEEFYASIKLVSGEEIMCMVLVDSTDVEDPLLAISDPVIFRYESIGPHVEIKVEPWIKLSNDGIFFIRLSRVITMTEITDSNMIEFYKNFLEDDDDDEDLDSNHREIKKDMGYIGSVEHNKVLLEQIFKLESSSKDDLNK